MLRNTPEGDERKLEKHFMTYDPLGILIDASNHSFLWLRLQGQITPVFIIEQPCVYVYVWNLRGLLFPGSLTSENYDESDPTTL